MRSNHSRCRLSRVRGPLLGAIALAIGCQKELTIEIGNVDFDYGFAVIYPEEGPPTRVTPPFGVADGRITFGEPPAILLENEEKRFVFVALRASDLPSSFEISRAS